MLSSPRKPARTIRIFSSAEYCLRVARRMALMTFSAGSFARDHGMCPHMWERLGIADVLADMLRGRGFEFAVERAVFVSVLHRLFVSGSDRSAWRVTPHGRRPRRR